MFGKIVAISTVKPVSQNYASATGSARVVKSIYFWSGTKYFKRNTADFHKDGYFLQNAGVTKDLRIAFVVCDVNSEQKRLQVKIFVFEKLEGNLTIWRLNWLYAIDQKQKKNGNNAQIQFLDRQNNFLLPLWEPVLPLCAILRAKSRVTHDRLFRACWGNVKEDTFRK